MRKKEKKIKIVLIFVVLLFVVTIGYATLSTTLNINGTSKINNSTWDIYFDELHVTNGSVTIDTNDNTQQAAEIDDTDDTLVNYSIVLNQPGDYYDFTVKVINSGSIDAMIDGITKTLKVDGVDKTNDMPTWLTYTTTYSDGVALANNQLLAANSEEELRVRVQFNRDISNTDFNNAKGKTLTLTFGVTYVQEGTGSVEVEHIRYTANKYNSGVSGYNQVSIGSALPSGVNAHLTADAAMLELKTTKGDNIDRTFYFKHSIKSNKVEKSYVEFIITNDMTGATPGTYTLRGGVNETNEDTPTVFNSNLDVLDDAFDLDSANCDDYTTAYVCHIGSISAMVSKDGSVGASDSANVSCSIDSTGKSSCNWE